MDKLLEHHQFATHAVVASASVSLGTTLTYPLDTIKTLIQVGSGPGKQLTTSQVVSRVLHFSGNSGLYSGLGWLTFGRISGLGARFGIYEILTAYCKDGRHDNYVHVSEALMAGAAAGPAETLITSPFEFLKIRAQVTAASRTPSIASVTERAPVSPVISRLLRGYITDMKPLNKTVGILSILNSREANLVSALREYPWMMTGTGRPPSVWDVRRPLNVVSLEGWQAFWRNLRSGIVRDSVFGGIFFSTWQFLHEAMLNWKAVGMNPIPRYDEEVGPLSPVAVSFAAGLSGALAAAGSHSFDTSRTRSQCIVLPKYIAKERKFLRWKTPGKRFEKWAGIHPSDRNILFRGVLVRMARCGVASSLIVGNYLLVVDFVASS